MEERKERVVFIEEFCGKLLRSADAVRIGAEAPRLMRKDSGQRRRGSEGSARFGLPEAHLACLLSPLRSRTRGVHPGGHDEAARGRGNAPTHSRGEPPRKEPSCQMREKKRPPEDVTKPSTESQDSIVAVLKVASVTKSTDSLREHTTWVNDSPLDRREVRRVLECG